MNTDQYLPHIRPSLTHGAHTDGVSADDLVQVLRDAGCTPIIQEHRGYLRASAPQALGGAPLSLELVGGEWQVRGALDMTVANRRTLLALGDHFRVRLHARQGGAGGAEDALELPSNYPAASSLGAPEIAFMAEGR